jgi:hypothetical protein
MKENRNFLMATKGVKVENIRILIVSIQEYTTKEFCNEKSLNILWTLCHEKNKTNN